MKVLVALALCGLSCVIASPTCGDYDKTCGTKTADMDKLHFETAAERDVYCKSILGELDCQLAFTERCPNTLTGAFRESLKEYRRAFGRFCDTTDPLSQKYLEKASCLNEKTRDAEEICSQRATEKEYCKRSVEVLKCTEEELIEMCGSDSEEVVHEFYKHKYAENDVFCKGME